MNDINHKQLERSLWKPIPVLVEVVVYKQWHKLSGPHAKGLMKLGQAVYQYGRPVTRYEAGIIGDGSQYGNFAAMRWWGLIEPGEKQTWTLTQRGWDFLTGKRRVSERALTLQGVCLGWSVPMVWFKELADTNTWEKADYLANRIAATEKDWAPNSLFSHLLTHRNA